MWVMYEDLKHRHEERLVEASNAALVRSSRAARVATAASTGSRIWDVVRSAFGAKRAVQVVASKDVRADGIRRTREVSEAAEKSSALPRSQATKPRRSA